VPYFGVMVAFAYMYPTMPIMLFLLPPIQARYVVAGLIVFDVLFIGAGDNVARLVHLGGALIGYLLVKAHYKGTDLSKFVRPIEKIWNPSLSSSPSSSGRKKRKKKNAEIHHRKCGRCAGWRREPDCGPVDDQHRYGRHPRNH
jgi:hypothetical protein